MLLTQDLYDFTYSKWPDLNHPTQPPPPAPSESVVVEAMPYLHALPCFDDVTAGDPDDVFVFFVLVLEVLLVLFTFTLVNSITLNNFLFGILNRRKCSTIWVFDSRNFVSLHDYDLAKHSSFKAFVL